MATPVATKKICTLCGIDVAGQKRTKDQFGRYYCQPCWEQQTAGAHAPAHQPAPAAQPTSRPSAQTPPADATSADGADADLGAPIDLGAWDDLATPPPIATPPPLAAPPPIAAPPPMAHAIAGPSAGRGAGVKTSVRIVGVIVFLGVGLGVYVLLHGLHGGGLSTKQMSITMDAPQSLQPQPYTDRQMNCSLRLPLGTSVRPLMVPGMEHAFAAVGPKADSGVAVEEMDHTGASFDDCMRQCRIKLNSDHPRNIAIEDEGRATLAGCDAYMMVVTVDDPMGRPTREYMVCVDAPNNKAYLLLGQALIGKWDHDRAALMSSLSTFELH